MKRKIHRILLLLLLLFYSNSCYLAWKIDGESLQQFTYSYDEEYTGIDTLISINGYYQQKEIREKTFTMFLKNTNSNMDTLYYFLIFYNNGLCNINFDDYARNFDNNGKFIDRLEDRSPRNMPLFFQKIVENTTTNLAKSFYSGLWGIYRISNDTIKIQAIHKSVSLNDGWAVISRQYKIVDTSTILQCDPESEQSKPVSATFMPTMIVPSPNYACLLKYRWFWRDENGWRKYMEEFGAWHEKK